MAAKCIAMKNEVDTDNIFSINFKIKHVVKLKIN